MTHRLFEAWISTHSMTRWLILPIIDIQNDVIFDPFTDKMNHSPRTVELDFYLDDIIQWYINLRLLINLVQKRSLFFFISVVEFSKLIYCFYVEIFRWKFVIFLQPTIVSVDSLNLLTNFQINIYSLMSFSESTNSTKSIFFQRKRINE